MYRLGCDKFKIRKISKREYIAGVSLYNVGSNAVTTFNFLSYFFISSVYSIDL